MNARNFQMIFQRLRKERELTQDEISKALGVSKSSVAMWETGQRLPSPELYEQIADFFNVDIDYLYGRTTIRQKIRFDEDGNMQRTLSQEESDLLDLYSQLNQEGREKVVDYISDLIDSGKYKKYNSAELVEKDA